MKHVAIASVISLVENYKTKNNHSNLKNDSKRKKMIKLNTRKLTENWNDMALITRI